ncbi:MAG: hypothetical protein RLT05_23795 [Bauldia litoralis]
MKRLVLIALLFGYVGITSGCAAVVAGTAAGAYVYGVHEENKEKRRQGRQ